MKFKIIKIILLVLWISVIFSFSLQQGSYSSNTSNTVLDTILKCLFIDVNNLKANNINLYYNLGTIIRKCAHMTEFAILSILSYLVFNKYIITLLFSILIASTDEFIQTFIPQRAGLFTDVLIDSVGICFGLLFIFIILKIKEKIYDN